MTTQKLSQVTSAFLLAALLGVAPLWAQSDHPKARPQDPPAAEKPTGGDESYMDFVASSKVLGGEAEAPEASTSVSSSMATAYAVGYPAPTPPVERLTVKTESGLPLEVKIVQVPGGRAIQTRWREKTRWRTRVVRVPVGATPAQVQQLLDKVLAGLVSKADLKEVSMFVNRKFADLNKRLDELETGQKAGFEKIETIVRSESAQT